MWPVYYSIMKNKYKKVKIKIKIIKDITYIKIANFKPHSSYLVSPNLLPLYTTITFFSTNLNEVLTFHSFSGALILWYILLISLAIFILLGLRYEAIYHNDHTTWKIYINIYVMVIICKDAVINIIKGLMDLICLFVIGGCVVIYELFNNNTFNVNKNDFIFRRYYNSICDENTVKSVMVFGMVFYFIFRFGVQWEDYYIYMNSLEANANNGASSNRGGDGNANPNPKPRDYSKLASTSANKEDENRGDSVSQFLGKDKLASDSFRWEDCKNTRINIAYPKDPIPGPDGLPLKQVISPFFKSLAEGSDPAPGIKPNSHLSGFPNPWYSRIASLSYKTDVSGKGDYIVASGSNVGLTWFQTGDLITCDLEKIKISGDFNKGEKEVAAMNLKKCNFIYTEWRGRKGVFIPPVFSEQVIIINRNGCKVPMFTSGVFIEGADLRLKKKN